MAGLLDGRLMWRQACSAGLGVWLMVSPAVLGYGGLAANVSWVIGPLVASVSFIAAFAIARPLRVVNVGLGLVLVVSTAATLDLVATLDAVIVGAGVVVLTLTTPSASTEPYGGGWGSLYRENGP